MQWEQKCQNLSWATFNQSDWRIWVTWPELTNQRRVFLVFALFCAGRSKRKIFVLWLGSFGHVAYIQKKIKSICLFLIKNHFSLLFLTHSFPLFTPLLSFSWHVMYPSIWLHSLCPLWWSSVHLSSYYYLPFVVFIPFIALAMSLVVITSLPIFYIFLSTLTFCFFDHIQCTGLCRCLRVYLICVFEYWHLPFFSFPTGHELLPSVMRTKDV